MTNVEAIDIVMKCSDPDNMHSAVAGIFLKEDIIEYDVNDWLQMPTHELLRQFSGYSEDSSSKYIEEVMEMEGESLTEDNLIDLSDRYQSVIETMIEYSRVRSLIKNKSER